MNIVIFAAGYQLNINAVLEVMVLANFGGFGLPARAKFFHEDDEVRISHGDGNAAHLAKGKLNGELVAYLGLAHVSFKFEFGAVAANQGAGLHAGAGTHHKLVSSLLRSQPGGDTAGAIAGNFSFRTISVEEAGADIGVGGGKQPLHAVGANALVAVAHAAADGGKIRPGVQPVHDEEIVAAGASLNERNGGGRSHSPSAGPRELTLLSKVDWRRRVRSEVCSWRAASTANCTREWPSILAIWTEVMPRCSSCRIRLSSAITVSASAPRTS